MNGIHQVLVLIAKEEFKFFNVFWVHFNLNILPSSTIENILKTFMILNGSDTEKTIG